MKFFSEGRKMVHSVAVLQNSQNANLFTFPECLMNKGNNKITELRTILQRESQNS